MKVKVICENGEILVKQEFEDKTIDFDYILFIDALYSKRDVSLDVDDNLDILEKEKLNEMFEQIKNCVANQE